MNGTIMGITFSQPKIEKLIVNIQRAQHIDYIERVRHIVVILLTAGVLSLHDRLLQSAADPGMYYVLVGSSPSQPTFPDGCVLQTM